MFNCRYPLLTISPYTVFIRVLSNSGVLSTKAKPNPAKPKWTSANCQQLWKTLSPESKADLKMWAGKYNYPQRSQKKSQHHQAKKQQEQPVKQKEYTAEQLLNEDFVTSFSYFSQLNLHRVLADAPTVAQRRALPPGFNGVRMGKLWKEERAEFRKQQIKLLNERKQLQEPRQGKYMEQTSTTTHTTGTTAKKTANKKQQQQQKKKRFSSSSSSTTTTAGKKSAVIAATTAASVEKVSASSSAAALPTSSTPMPTRQPARKMLQQQHEKSAAARAFTSNMPMVAEKKSGVKKGSSMTLAEQRRSMESSDNMFLL